MPSCWHLVTPILLLSTWYHLCYRCRPGITYVIAVDLVSPFLSLSTWYHICYRCRPGITYVIAVDLVSPMLSLSTGTWYHLCYRCRLVKLVGTWYHLCLSCRRCRRAPGIIYFIAVDSSVVLLVSPILSLSTMPSCTWYHLFYRCRLCRRALACWHLVSPMLSLSTMPSCSGFLAPGINYVIAVYYAVVIWLVGTWYHLFIAVDYAVVL
ncbi:hypothetical protein DPMN_049409 [Dreissena polymorpha]|uniref:Uncharacterized protein n=1 Tax=Dreissena polymorpha TaxID=45954 RepID=A0A9D4CFB0_DREPO|nr:hypothetical protein DPMN_049409 [Dreissena polymorpha]